MKPVQSALLIAFISFLTVAGLRAQERHQKVLDNSVPTTSKSAGSYIGSPIVELDGFDSMVLAEIEALLAELSHLSDKLSEIAYEVPARNDFKTRWEYNKAYNQWLNEMEKIYTAINAIEDEIDYLKSLLSSAQQRDYVESVVAVLLN